MAKSWKTRTGSSELNTVTALVRRMSFVRAAAADSATAGDCVVRTVMLADAEDVETDLVCQLDLLDEVAQPPCGVHARTDVRERVQAEFHRRFLSGLSQDIQG